MNGALPAPRRPLSRPALIALILLGLFLIGTVAQPLGGVPIHPADAHSRLPHVAVGTVVSALPPEKEVAPLPAPERWLAGAGPRERRPDEADREPPDQPPR